MTSMQEPSSQMARNLRAAFDLFETGVAMMRQRLRREHPDATDAEIDIRLCQWLQHRPGAEAGDSAGRPVDVSRFG